MRLRFSEQITRNAELMGPSRPVNSIDATATDREPFGQLLDAEALFQPTLADALFLKIRQRFAPAKPCTLQLSKHNNVALRHFQREADKRQEFFNACGN